MLWFHRPDGQQVAGANLGGAGSRQPLPRPGDHGSCGPGEPPGDGVISHRADQSQLADKVGMPVGHSLSDGPSHRITDEPDRGLAEPFDDRSDVVGLVLDFETFPLGDRQPVRSMVDHHDPETVCEQRSDFVPLRQGRTRQPMDEDDHRRISGSDLSYRDLPVTGEHSTGRDRPGVFLFGRPPGRNSRAEHPPEDQKQQTPAERFQERSPTANT